MKTLTLFTSILLLLLSINQSLSALDLFGSLKTDNRIYLKDNNDFSWQEYRISLKSEAKPQDNAHFYSEVWLRYLGFPVIESSQQLTDRDKISPWNYDVREAYVDLYGFISPLVDIRVGKQRIAWGTADRLNPTDNLNPDDLEDIWDFGRHQGSFGFKVSYYNRFVTVTSVYLPLFIPALLPLGNLSSEFFSEIELPQGTSIGNVSDEIFTPENNLKESSIVAFKLGTRILHFDLSCSYIYGRDDIPIVRKVTILPTINPEEVDISSELMYPRMNIIGMDIAGSLWEIGTWSEAAIFFPQQVSMTKDLSALGMGIQESIVLEKKPYVRYIIGVDYSFMNTIYANLQYMHGFFHERGAENLKDYFMFVIEWRDSDNKFILSPLQGGIEVSDFTNIKNSYAIILSPEVSYSPFMSTEIKLGYRFIDGKDTTLFGKMKENDEAYLRITYSF